MKKDEYARVLDFLPRGKSEVPPHKRKPIAQVVGEKYFSLLEIVPRKNISFDVGTRVYIGEGVRDKVDHIERRIKYDWLTPTAKTELKIILEDIIRDREKEFIDFFNTSGTISTRLHKLEILPRIGKRHRQDILNEREIKKFDSFKDMQKRVKNMPDPVKILAEKIIEELKNESKYYLFVPYIQIKPSTGKF
ncbi:MAG: DUF655 domain-containing protein [Candidatus Altiarchaeales archaeon]|nr:MAG: DUF655 domain-containing protein [Candidatus Altiarchaeales archaeon]